MELIYRGIFYTRLDVRCEVRILRAQDEAPSEVGMLSFAGDEPLVIEWDEKSKEEVVCGSSATLKLVSPGDRTYIDLYSEAVGEIRMDVLKNDVLYWSGTLDPEFYEEPYSTMEDYEVSLTFSDFGILTRLNYDLAGLKTLRELVDYSLGRSGVNVLRIDESYISSCLNGSHALSLSDLSVRSDNFYDEDGEALSLKEVLEGVLQPLALRMVQRGGVVWVYDLHGLYSTGIAEKVRWMSDDQMLGVDVIYNNAKITWSPYAQSGVLSESECYVDETDPNFTALNESAGKSHGESTCYSFHYSGDMVDWIDATDCGFTLWTSRKGKNATLQSDRLRFFKIVPQEDGQSSEGVAIKWSGVAGIRVNYTGGYSANLRWGIYGSGWEYGWLDSGVGDALWKSQELWLPPVDTRHGLRLRVGLNLLMDCRFNPFESASNLMKGIEQKSWYDQWQKRGNFVYIPVTLKWQPDGSEVIYCWTNQDVLKIDKSRPVTTLGGTLGHWEVYDVTKDANPDVYGYLCWYQSDDRAEKSGVLGWRMNRPCINPHTKRLTTALSGAADGQYVPYPTYGGQGGRLWMEVRRKGWMLSDGNVNLSADRFIDSYGLWKDHKTWWCLMQLPEFEVQNSSQFDSEINTDDVEYKAVLNSAAKEDIEIETICGTAEGGIPSARGVYFQTSTYHQIQTLTRAGRTAQVEELLIGTLYSQFASRRTRLEGTMEQAVSGLCVWREAMQGDRRFLMTGATEDVANDTSESVLVELRPDEYEKKA